MGGLGKRGPAPLGRAGTPLAHAAFASSSPGPALIPQEASAPDPRASQPVIRIRDV